MEWSCEDYQRDIWAEELQAGATYHSYQHTEYSFHLTAILEDIWREGSARAGSQTCAEAGSRRHE